MDDYADIYYVDTRNATTDHRRPGSQQSSSPWRPSAPPPSRTVYVPPGASGPVYYAPPMAPQQAGIATLFGKLTTGQVIEMVAQAFVALQSLPAAPVATRDTNTDLANLTLYQGAIAQHAKRDEQVRVLGRLVAALVG